MRVTRFLLALGLLAGLFQPGVASAGTADPMDRGPHDVEVIDYDAGYTTVRDPNGVTFAQDFEGVLFLPDAPGPRPLLIFMHGRHDAVLASRFSYALHYPDGPEHQQIVLNGLRIPLDAFDVDLGRVVAVELRFGRATPKGSIQLADLMFQEPR